MIERALRVYIYKWTADFYAFMENLRTKQCKVCIEHVEIYISIKDAFFFFFFFFQGMKLRSISVIFYYIKSHLFYINFVNSFSNTIFEDT